MSVTLRKAPLPVTATALLSLLLTACSSSVPDNLGVQNNGELTPCPDSPNCVSSFSERGGDHHIEAFEAPANEWQELRDVVKSTPRIDIAEQQEGYLRAEASTRVMRFVDDLEFRYRPEEQLIHVRSASRMGYSDFGVNRKRLEGIRKRLENSK